MMLTSILQVDQPAQGVWQAAAFAGRHPGEARVDDRTRGERAELAGEHHLPDEQHG